MRRQIIVLRPKQMRITYHRSLTDRLREKRGIKLALKEFLRDNQMPKKLHRPMHILRQNDRRREEWMGSLTQEQVERMPPGEYIRKWMSFGPGVIK